MHGALRWATLLVAGAVFAAVAMAACGGSSLKQTGESCNASSECDRGLVCDFGREPHVCASSSTQNDAAPVDDADVEDAGLDGQIDARPIDARPIDAPPPIDAAIDAPPPIDAAIDAP
jgi:hypothetical protein